MSKRVIGKSLDEIKGAIVATLKAMPTIAGVEAVNHFKASFKNEGFTNDSLVKWKARKKKDEGRAILTKTGRLRRGIKVMRKTENSVTVGVDLSEVPYAQVHNEGFNGTVAVRAHVRRNTRNNVYSATTKKLAATGINMMAAGSRKMNIPKRQFIGDSKQLDTNITNKGAAHLKKLLA